MFTINRSLLATELAVIQTVAEKKTTIPVLAFILFRMENNVAHLTASDSEITITTQVEATGESYQGCIPARQLGPLVKLLDGESIQFTPKPNGRIEIKSGTSKHILVTLAAEHFPQVEAVQGSEVTLPAASLGTMLRRVGFCAGQDGEGQGWTFQGINFEVADGTLTTTATNSRQLGTASVPVGKDVVFDALIPTRATAAIERLCESEGDIQITVNANHAKFQNGNRTLTTSLIAGKFPDWRTVLPESLSHQTVIDPESLLASVRRACITTRETKLIRHPLALSFSQKQLQITSESEDGESTDTVPLSCPSLNGSNVDIRVNGEHVLNFIAKTEGSISCAFGEDKRLVQLGIEGDNSYRYITMALR